MCNKVHRKKLLLNNAITPPTPTPQNLFSFVCDKKTPKQSIFVSGTSI